MTDATTPPEPDQAAGDTDADLDDLALDNDLALALELADLADRAAMDRFRTVDLRVDTKPDRTFVTEADLAVERAVRELITQRRPGDGVLGEEYGTEGSGARQWIVDPIDGTANFLRGVPVWGALIALTVDGAPVVGVASMPALGRRWWGAQGLGAFTTDAPGAQPRAIRVSSVGDLADASLSFQSIAQWRDAGQLDRLLALGERVWRDRAYGDLWSYCLLAEGLVDVVAEFDLKPWDIAAAVPIVEAAGGRVTSIDGAALGDGSVLATNGRLHDAVLEVLEGEAASDPA
ncbi:histidinol-phosphatase [Agromyces sp. NPDC056523]|uniref:histidinol-phosphatase n=1 Tax=Agromyces sp. NPDC056523 TaxID=3345850 RepID=UPI003670E9BA